MPIHFLAEPCLDCGYGTLDNDAMEIPGRIQNGVVVFEGETKLPNGTPVTVVYPRVRIWRKPGKKKRVKFPLVRSEHPGTLHLTSERIAEILEEEDIAGLRESLKSFDIEG